MNNIKTENNVPVLYANSLTKIYKGATGPSLNRFTISINKGDIFGLLGPNGAGKTTALLIMSALLRPTEGSVTISGIDSTKHAGKIKQMIGFVPQDIALYSDLTGQENLQYFGRLYGLHGKKLKHRVEEYLDMFSLNNSADKRINTCSGGIKRRFKMAIGMLHKPKLIFLDEPTVGIDSQSRNLILEKLSMIGKTGTAMIYTTHYMEEAETLCNNIAILDGGKIMKEGSPNELILSVPGCKNLGELFLTLTGRQLRD